MIPTDEQAVCFDSSQPLAQRIEKDIYELTEQHLLG